jgi:hypothetical protein
LDTKIAFGSLFEDGHVLYCRDKECPVHDLSIHERTKERFRRQLPLITKDDAVHLFAVILRKTQG